MKKIICLFLALFVLLFCTSCGEVDEVWVGYENDRYIFKIETLEYGATLIKYDIVEKTAAVACPDPLCEHKDCAFVDITNYSITNNCIYLVKGNYPLNAIVYVYDFITNKVEYLIEGIQVSTIYGVENFAYFTLSHMEYNEDGSVKAEVFDIYRRDESTGELKIVSEEPVSGFTPLQDYKNGKLIWHDAGLGGTYFTTDFDFRNREDIESPSSSEEPYTFKLESSHTEGQWYTAYRTDNETKEKITIFENAFSFRWTNASERRSLLYIPSTLVLEEVDGEEEYVRVPQRKISYIDAYDTSKTFTWEIPENISVGQIYAEARDECRIGSYIGVSASEVTRDENGNDLYYDKGILVINYETKELFGIFFEDTRVYLTK